MSANDQSKVHSLRDLREFVQRTICDRYQLLLGAFQFYEKVLIRHGKPCGLHFTLHGPRAVQYSAIWDVARQTVLFYDSDGNRNHRSELTGVAEVQNELDRLVDSGKPLSSLATCG